MLQAEYRGFKIVPHEYPTQGGELFWQHPDWDGDPEDNHLYGSAGSFQEANDAIDEFIETHGEIENKSFTFHVSDPTGIIIRNFYVRSSADKYKADLRTKGFKEVSPGKALGKKRFDYCEAEL